jgi:hypothetical protein
VYVYHFLDSLIVNCIEINGFSDMCMINLDQRNVGNC